MQLFFSQRLTELPASEGFWHFVGPLTSHIPRGERKATGVVIERLLICRYGSISNIRQHANLHRCPPA
jgi:hypothetical protein